MQTTAEFIKENQSLVLFEIIEAIRTQDKWGTHGLFAEIGLATEISPAYVGRCLSGRQRLTETFVAKVAEYLGVSMNTLTGTVPPSIKTQDTGEGKTPEWLVALLAELVTKSSQNAVAKGTGLRLRSVQNMLKGIGEPRLSTLQRIANYTGRTFTIEIKPSA